eukprot:14011591-Alexandrium_andersonii.AAC.2
MRAVCWSRCVRGRLPHGPNDVGEHERVLRPLGHALIDLLTLMPLPLPTSRAAQTACARACFFLVRVLCSVRQSPCWPPCLRSAVPG